MMEKKVAVAISSSGLPHVPARYGSSPTPELLLSSPLGSRGGTRIDGARMVERDMRNTPHQRIVEL
jgi:hypothetical protein